MALLLSRSLSDWKDMKMAISSASTTPASARCHPAEYKNVGATLGNRNSESNNHSRGRRSSSLFKNSSVNLTSLEIELKRQLVRNENMNIVNHSWFKNTSGQPFSFEALASFKHELSTDLRRCFSSSYLRTNTSQVKSLEKAKFGHLASRKKSKKALANFVFKTAANKSKFWKSDDKGAIQKITSLMLHRSSSTTHPLIRTTHSSYNCRIGYLRVAMDNEFRKRARKSPPAETKTMDSSAHEAIMTSMTTGKYEQQSVRDENENAVHHTSQSSTFWVKSHVNDAAPESLEIGNNDELSGWPGMDTDENRSPSPSLFENSSSHLKDRGNTPLKHLSVRDENKNNVNNPWCKNASEGSWSYEPALPSFEDEMHWVSDNTGKTSTPSGPIYNTPSMETFGTSPYLSGFTAENRSTDSEKSFMHMNFNRANSMSNTEVATAQPKTPVVNTSSMTPSSAKRAHPINKKSKSKESAATSKKNEAHQIKKVSKTPCFKSHKTHPSASSSIKPHSFTEAQ